MSLWKGRRFMGRQWWDNAPTHGLLVLVAAIWGLGWVAGRVVALEIEPATAAWLRYSIACICLFMYLFYRNGGRENTDLATRMQLPVRGDLRRLLLIAFFSTLLYQLFFMTGMARTAAGDASLIVTLNPVFAAILAVPMLGRRMTLRLAGGLAIGATGVAIVTGWSPNVDIPTATRIVGDVLIMFAAASWATSTNLVKGLLEQQQNPSHRTQNPLSIIVWSSFFGWLMLSPFVGWELWYSGWTTPTIEIWLWIAFLAVFSTVISYVWFAQGIDRIGPTASSTYVFLVPVFGIISGWAILGERLGWSLAIGFVLILIGVRMAQIESVEK